MGNAVDIPSDCSCLSKAWGREIMPDRQSVFAEGIANKLADNKPVDTLSFCDFVVIKLSETLAGSDEAHALKSFIELAAKNANKSLSVSDINLWIAEMTAQNIPHSRRIRNFTILHSVYREYAKRSNIADSDPFINAGNAIKLKINKKDYATAFSNAKILDSYISRLVEVSKTRPAIAAFLYMLYSANGNMEQAIYLKLSSIACNIQQINELINSLHPHHRQKYAFKFDQSQKRAPQLLRECRADLEFTLRNIGMTFPNGFSGDSIVSIWIAKALQSSITLSEIRSAIKHIPAEFSYLSLIEPTVMTERERDAILQSVADTIIDTTPSWHVMKLRKGITPDAVEGAIKSSLPHVVNTITFFYPTYKKAHKENRKIMFEAVPYLPDILFFKVRTDKIPLIFRHIGDIAWCYRQTNSSSSPYTTIPISEMEMFQKAVEQFTSDINVELTERAPLGIGKKVRITSGMMEGMETVIYDFKNSSSDQEPGSRVCCLRLSDNSHIMWRVDIEEKYLEPIE